MARRPRLTFRFSVNRKGITSAQEAVRRIRSGVRGSVEALLVRYADKNYAKIVADLKTQIERDARRELRHLARVYSRTIIGAGYTKTGVDFSNLTTAMPGGGTTIGGILPKGSWPPRAPEYIARKRRKNLTPNWFIAETKTLKSTMGKASVWEEMFGPVRVSIIRKDEAAFNDAGGQARIQQKAVNVLGGNNIKGDNIRIGLLEVRVEALGKVQPYMFQRYSVTSGLIGLVAQHDEEMAYRLGGRNPALYRPTLEPFLEFYLTKSLPYTVNQRIQKGLRAKLFQKTAGNAGRVSDRRGGSIFDDL